MEIMRIINKGMLTSIQDLGRFGFKQYGVPQSGAMDSYAMRCANLLLDNDENTPVIEITYGVFKCEFSCDTAISVTGGDIGGYINGKSLPMWQTVYVKKDDVLEFRGGRHFRTYLAINNGLDCEKVLGSCSTYERAGLNKPLENNQIIYGSVCNLTGIKSVLDDEIPRYDKIVRFIKGPHSDFFQSGHMKSLCAGEYEVLPASDRMGIRLSGNEIVTKNKSLLSCPLAMGAVQVPASGNPIVIMADGQVSGGYPVIGCIISADLNKLAQKKQGEKIVFKQVTIDEAVRAKKLKKSNLLSIKQREFQSAADREYNVRVNGKEYFVEVYEN